MSARYAEGTTVAVDQSIGELNRIVTRFGASQFGYATSSDSAAVMFTARGRVVKFTVEMPSLSDYALTPTGRQRQGSTAQQQAWEGECKRRWRTLVACVKAKFAAIDDGVVAYEDEFLAHFVTGNGRTMAEMLHEDPSRLDSVLAKGNLQLALGPGRG